MIWGMENKDVRSRAGSTRRAFLSASAVTAVAAPLLSGTALAETDPALSRQAPDPGLRAMLREIDPDRIKATILKLVSSRIPVPTTITNVIATLKGTASPERFYVVTGHLDSRVTEWPG